MLKIPKNLQPYIDVDGFKGKLVIVQELPKDLEGEFKIFERSFKGSLDKNDLSEY